MTVAYVMSETNCEPFDYLMSLVRRGDDDAAHALYERHIGHLLSIVSRNLSSEFSSLMDADDIAQSAFRTIFVRARQGEFVLQEDADFWKLLVTISLNKLRNRTRDAHAQKRKPAEGITSLTHQDIENHLRKAPEIDDGIVFGELLERALRRLSDRERQVVLLRMEGSSQKEIAERLGISDRQLRRVMDKIRSKAASLFEDE